MTTTEKNLLKAELRAEILKELQQGRKTTGMYTAVRKRCYTYFHSIKLENQNFGALMLCENMVRQAFKERHGIPSRTQPSQYIATEKDAEEYYQLFERFLLIYRMYLQGWSYEKSKEKAPGRQQPDRAHV